MTQKYNVAVVGATGAVGAEIIQILENTCNQIKKNYVS